MTRYLKILLPCCLLLFSNCSKKITPTVSENKTEVKSEPEVKTAPVPKKKTSSELFPKVITVNDAAAQKSVDGRLYYDLMNHRYWKNYKDGKYYLFNKSMYKNPDFRPPASDK